MQRNASFSSILLLVSQEIRRDKGTHPGYIARMIVKTPGEWAKIEAGQTALTTDVFMGVCQALEYTSANVMYLAERLTQMYSTQGWYFQASYLGKDDELLPLIKSYYASKGYEVIKDLIFERVSVTTLALIDNSIPTIVRYCCEPNFKEWIDHGAEQGLKP